MANIKTYYKATVFTFVEEDNYKHGCTGKSFSRFDDTIFKSPSLTGLIKEIESYYDEKVYLVDDGNNRLELQRMETDEGYKANDVDTIRWREGKRRLWLVNYSFDVAKITEDENLKAELEQLDLETI